MILIPELVLASHLLVAAGGTASATCPSGKAANIQVSWRTEPVKYDFTRSIAQLEAKGTDSKNPYGVHTSTDVGGLMSGSIKVRSRIQVSTLNYPTLQQSCLWVDTLTVEVVIDPTVFVASDYPRGSCKHAAILEHEHKHVETDREIARTFTPQIRTALEQATAKVGMVGPKPMAEVQTYQRRIQSYIESELKTVTDRMYGTRVERQQGIDTREEYDRVAAECP